MKNPPGKNIKISTTPNTDPNKKPIHATVSAMAAANTKMFHKRRNGSSTNGYMFLKLSTRFLTEPTSVDEINSLTSALHLEPIPL